MKNNYKYYIIINQAILYKKNFNINQNNEKVFFLTALTLSLPVTRICVNYSTVYNDTLVAKGLKKDKGILLAVVKLTYMLVPPGEF